jgi:hypothetical protein
VNSGNTSASRRISAAELGRVSLLIVFACWLFHPFATSNAIGGGDALWYANMLADFVIQWRAGVFPVFVGQTEYAFNGAVYPLRVAPLYQHWGGFLDLVTGRQLNIFLLQHLVVITVGVAGLFSAYACLRRLVPQRPWNAFAGSLLYVACPGALALIFSQDLYMSWMALPFLPIALYGSLRSYENDSFPTWLCMAVGLAGLWLAHAPIAFWISVVVAFTQTVRLVFVRRCREAWKRAAIGALSFAALGSYPFISVASLRSPDLPPPATSAALDRPELMVTHLRQALPAAVMPVSPNTKSISDIQLGYSLWGVLLIGIATSLRTRSLPLLAFLVGGVGLASVLMPIPWWTEYFWLQLAPESVRRLTYYWPMHRLYLVLAGITTISGIVALSRTNRQFASVVLIVSCGWSIAEARKFVQAIAASTSTSASSIQALRSENVMLMNHAYGLFSKLPSYFSHGVMDPYAESRLWTADSAGQLTEVKGDGIPIEHGTLVGEIDANPGIINYRPRFRLEPRQRYDLDLRFQEKGYQGVLQMAGASLFRQYSLPTSGEALAFGSLGENSRTIPLWTSSPAGDEVMLRFIPTGGRGQPSEFLDFADFTLRTRATEPIFVTSLVPYQAKVTSPQAAWLETPRMYVPGYVATVNGSSVPVSASKEALVQIPLPSGTSNVTLSYRAPLMLSLSYWVTLFSWAVALLLAGRAVLRRARGS